MISENTAWIILVLSIAGLAVAILALRRRKRKRAYRLEKDPSGLWRYHEGTKFRRRESYADISEKPQQTTKGDKTKPIAVIKFDGDLRGKQHENFGKLIDEVEVNKDELSEVVVRIESPGGFVAPYGHLYAQMERVRNLGLPLTACVDVVAASGGYLMSLPAEKILAAPFAHVGSIGVAAFVPNVRGFLLKQDIHPRTFTAGRWKRTVSLTDDASPEEVSHFQSQLESIHQIFCDAVKKYRPSAKLEEVTTGDHWTAQEAVEKNLGLVDEIVTSEEYLLRRNRQADLIEFSQRRSFWEENFGQAAASLLDAIEVRARRILFGDVRASLRQEC